MKEEMVPVIKVYLSEDFDSSEMLRELLYGVEEEGLFCEVEKRAADSAVALAFRGANDSVLGVGIGVDGTGCLAVHFQKLVEMKPLFTLNYWIEPDKVRDIASNAARLVKGIPFRF